MGERLNIRDSWVLQIMYEKYKVNGLSEVKRTGDRAEYLQHSSKPQNIPPSARCGLKLEFDVFMKKEGMMWLAASGYR
jgi:hypothetical protein